MNLLHAYILNRIFPDFTTPLHNFDLLILYLGETKPVSLIHVLNYVRISHVSNRTILILKTYILVHLNYQDSRFIYI